MSQLFGTFSLVEVQGFYRILPDFWGAEQLSIPLNLLMANGFPFLQHALLRVSEVLPATASDAEILEFARREERVVVTQDLDFSTLLALGGYNQPSLITLRLLASDPDTVNQKLIEILPGIERELEEGCAVTRAS